MRMEIVLAGAAFLAGAALAGTAGRPPEAAPEGAHRVVSLAPALTETIFALGAGSRIVGVASGVAWPPEALSIERIGGYYDADLERLVGLRPGVVFLQGLHAPVRDQAAELGIRVCRIDMETLDEIEGGIRRIGAELGVDEAAGGLVRRIRGELDAVRARSRLRWPRRVFLHIAYGTGRPAPPFLTTGGRAFLSELLAVAGGGNVYADENRAYPEISVESLVERRPEVVMVSCPGRTPSDGEAAEVRAAWQTILRADVRVVFLTSDGAQVPGPRIGEIAREMERLLEGD